MRREVDEVPSEASVVPERAPSVRTFLIADVRGYTRFTVERGDEAAAALTSRFAALVQQAVGARNGEVIELRGDEALTVFSSTRWPTWLAVRARLRAAQGKWEEALADFEDALGYSRERSLALAVAETAHAYGEMLALRGEIGGARERFAEALSVFRRMRAQPYIERTESVLVDLE